MSRMITVCAACERASCSQGMFYCDRWKGAGTKELPLKTVQWMNREHPSYWTQEWADRAKDGSRRVVG